MDASEMTKVIDSHRDELGRRVREVWVLWAKRQPNPKASWLVPYEELSEADKEADRCIGSALWGDFINEHTEALAKSMLPAVVSDRALAIVDIEVSKRYGRWISEKSQYTEGRLHEAHEIKNLLLTALPTAQLTKE